MILKAFSSYTGLTIKCRCITIYAQNLFTLFPVSYSQKQPTECYIKKGVLKNFAKFKGKHVPEPLFE